MGSGNTASGVWADSAYRSEAIEEKGLTSRIHRKCYRNRSLRDWEKVGSKSRSRFRAQVEHVFGARHNAMGGAPDQVRGGLLVRSFGFMRVRARIRFYSGLHSFVRLTTSPAIPSPSRGEGIGFRSNGLLQGLLADCRHPRQSHENRYKNLAYNMRRLVGLQRLARVASW